MTSDDFRAQWSTLLESEAADHIRENRIARIAANRAPWTGTGMELATGDQVSVFAVGRAWLASYTSAWQDAHFTLWYRVARCAPIFRASRGSRTFVVRDAGELEITNLFPTMWADESGVPEDAAMTSRAAGDFDVVAIRWRRDAEAGLDQLARGGNEAAAMAAKELASIRHPVRVPEGWKYLWTIGESHVFSEAEPGVIRCDASDEAAILQKQVSAPFVPGTRLTWSWKADLLPTDEGENTVANHDYLSVAVEFDNGRDLTYFWSAKLAPETSFHCPVSYWRHRETHLVVHSGGADLGRWINEDRDLWQDYRSAIGSQPSRIVAVWLIAVSNFGHRRALCEYRDLQLKVGDGAPIMITAQRVRA